MTACLLAFQVVRKSDDFDTLYMPVWSWAEIETARPIYPDVELDWAKKLFKKLGGVVRCSSDIVFKLHAQQGFLPQTCSCLAGMS